MSNSQNFRSAFNGFNREDVVHYLEYLNSKHTSLVNQLSQEADNLRQKLNLAADAIATDSSRAEQIVALESERDALKAQLAEALQAAENADAARAAAEAECEALRQQLCTAPAANEDEVVALRLQLAQAQEKCAGLEARLQNNTSANVEKELEAYRRAERIERLARERADQLYRQTNGVLADASLKVDQVASDIGGIADQVLSQLQVLQQAVTGSKQALKDAADVMYTLRPQLED